MELLKEREAHPCAPAPDALAAAREAVTAPLTEYESMAVTDYYMQARRVGDPYALVRAVEHALRERLYESDAYAAAARAEGAAEADGRRGDLMRRIAAELERAYGKHGRESWGRHEFYAILLEEVEEVWDAIKRDLPQAEVEKELVQVAAMCFRYYETGDRYRAPSSGTEAGP